MLNKSLGPSKEDRADDASLEVIRRRLKRCEKEIRPLLDYYGKPLVHRIDADQSPAEVLFDVLRHVVKV